MPKEPKATTVEAVDPAQPRTISFKLLRNIMLPALAQFMRNGVHPTPAVRMRELPGTERMMNVEGRDPHTQTPQMQRQLRTAVVPIFSMETTYTIELESTEPRPIVRKAGQSDLWIEKLADREMERALAAQERMDSLRRVLAHHAKPLVEGATPAIEIVDDASNFMTENPFLSDAEAAARERERQDALGLERATLAAATGAK